MLAHKVTWAGLVSLAHVVGVKWQSKNEHRRNQAGSRNMD